MAFSPDGTRVLTADGNGTAKIWDVGVSGDAEWMNLPIDGDWFDGVTYTPDGKRLLGSVPGGNVTMWDAQTGQNLRVFEGHKESVISVAFSSDGNLVVLGSNGPNNQP